MTKRLYFVAFLLILGTSLSDSDNSFPKNPKKDKQMKSDEKESLDTQNSGQELNENQRQKSNDLYEKAVKLLEKPDLNKRKAFSLLEESAKLDDMKAKEMVAKAHLFGDNLPIDWGRAFKYLESIPVNQSSSAHLFLGFMYSLGLGVKSSIEKSIFHYRLAANLDNSLAKMAMAFRYLYGLGEQKSCRKALDLYQNVATNVVEDSKHFGGNPINVRHLWQTKDFSDVRTYLIDKDLIGYYQFLAKSGDINARVSLGQLYYFGGYGVKKDRFRAFNLFKKLAESGNGNALAFMGKFHLEGSSFLQQNYTKAFELFEKSVEKGNPIGMTELGLMYRHGIGVEVNFEKAFRFFAQSSRNGWAEGLLQIGLLYMNGMGVARDYRKAVEYLTLASNSKHLLAFYNLGQMHSTGTGVIRSCPKAVSYLKSVAERGVWSQMLTEANADYEKGSILQAFMKFAFLSETGYELAQSNTAFIAENNEIPVITTNRNTRLNLALMYWSVSGMQGMTFSRIKIGDYHYYGLGTPVDYKMSALHYRRASEFQYSSQALFNLGYMHENGYGVQKNLKMAQIYYQMAAHIDNEAKIPVLLMTAKLRAQETIDSLIQIMNLENYFGTKWDLVLISVLFVALVIAIYIHRRNN